MVDCSLINYLPNPKDVYLLVDNSCLKVEGTMLAAIGVEFK